MKRFLIFGIAVILTGCQDDGSIGFPGSPAWFMTATPEAQAAYFTQVCATYGFQPKTPEMAQCVQTESNTRRAQASERMKSISESNRTYRSPVHTNCTQWGNNVNCTSY